VLFCVMCVICVLRLIVVPLPPGKNQFAVKINNNKLICFLPVSLRDILQYDVVSSSVLSQKRLGCKVKSSWRLL
jgi:hypothetical protein